MTEYTIKISEIITGDLREHIEIRDPEGIVYLKDEVTASVLKEFLCCCEIPHGTHNEKAITDWYRDRFEAKGWKVQIDQGLNMICDIPASPGHENVPLMAIQGHTDMVCAYEEGSPYDPLRDSIKTVIRRDEKSGRLVLSSDGTSSLGADCCMGIATAVWAAEDQSLKHGPIRFIFTAREEIGLVGVKEIDPSWLDDVAVMVNVDGFDCYKIVAGSASGRRVTFGRDMEDENLHRYPGQVALEISVGGLKGGHSGFDIHLGRGNALKLLFEFLYRAEEQDARFRLASFNGGIRHNVIPVEASAVIMTDDDSAKIILDLAAEMAAELREKYAEADPGVTLEAKAAEAPEQIASEELHRDFMWFMSRINSGPYSYMDDMPDAVDTSSNLGEVVFDASSGKQVEIHIFERSMGGAHRMEIAEKHDKAAETSGFVPILMDGYEPWVYDPDSRLLAMAAEEYYNVSGKDIEIKVSHVGLEPSVFGEFKSDIEMICIGTDIIDAHSVSERVNLDTIKPFALTLRNIICRYAVENR